jgi:hypothetical protein
MAKGKKGAEGTNGRVTKMEKGLMRFSETGGLHRETDRGKQQGSDRRSETEGNAELIRDRWN